LSDPLSSHSFIQKNHTLICFALLEEPVPCCNICTAH
jgi:hypothetical protein